MAFPLKIEAGRFLGLSAAVVFAALLSACSNSSAPATPDSGSTNSTGAVHAARALHRGFGIDHIRADRGPAISAYGLQPAYVHHDANNVVYDSIGATLGPKSQLSSYIYSEGYECCSVPEYGDGVVFTEAGRQLKTVEVVMKSEACQSNAWYETTCTSAPKSTFAMPITLNVYSVTGYPSGVPTVGQLLTTRTQTFAIKYRPSANNKVCTGPNAGGFIGPVDKECDNGIAQAIAFDMIAPKTILPAQAIITVEYNTSDYGPTPYGENTPCFTQSGGCPYDSLNVSANGNGALAGEGGNIDPNGVFINYENAGFYCSGNPYGQPPGGTLTLDTPCWAGYHPEIKVDTF